jgi:hypothetical protein
MKKAYLYLLSFLFLPVISNAQPISGQGDVVKQEIQLETLKGVKLGFSGDIILTQGSPQKIVLEGQQNIIDNIKRDVNDGIWRVNYERGVIQSKPVKVHITLATLEEAVVSGSGHITGTNTFQNLGDFDAVISGSGGIDLSVNAGDVEANISGSGDISLKGSARTLEARISGSGEIRASDLQTSDCEVSISGSGDATIHCTSSIETAISGSGDVRYKGNAEKVKASISGSGDVREID